MDRVRVLGEVDQVPDLGAAQGAPLGDGIGPVLTLEQCLERDAVVIEHLLERDLPDHGGRRFVQPLE